MAKWFYFLSSKAIEENGYLHGKNGKVLSTVDSFKKLALNGNLEDDVWGGIREYFDNRTGRKSGIDYGVDRNDEIYIAARTGNAGTVVNIIGYAIVEDIYNTDNENRIKLKFDNMICRKYSKDPIIVTINRKGAFPNLQPINISDFKSERKKEFELDENITLKAGKSRRTTAASKKTIELNHDLIVEKIASLFTKSGYKTGKSSCYIDPRTDVLCLKDDIFIIAEIKTNPYGRSESAVREAISQLLEYAWLFKREYRELEAKRLYKLSVFQNKPDDVFIEFLEDHGIIVIWYNGEKVCTNSKKKLIDELQLKL